MERIGRVKQAGLEQTGIGIPHVAGDDREHHFSHQHRRTPRTYPWPWMARLCAGRAAHIELVGIQGSAGGRHHRAAVGGQAGCAGAAAIRCVLVRPRVAGRCGGRMGCCCQYLG
uniref:Uncharacterized protein n=1 Tax=Pseudomonas aeruginosa TaxID=287 RepID=A0A894X7J1_PSEAI|nr:hypothetical protein [Pseudomonas aeruginosa]